MNFSNWNRSRSKPAAGWVTLAGSDLSYKGDNGECRAWQFRDGEIASIHFFSIKPDLPQSHELDRFVSEYEARVKADGVLLVECSVVEVRGFSMVRTIVKLLQAKAYIGAYTLPFAGFSYVVKTQSEVRGYIGLREAVLLDEGMRTGTVTIDPESASPIKGNWNPDSAEFDARFPWHAVSRVRRHLQQIPECLQFDNRLFACEKFQLPGVAGA